MSHDLRIIIKNVSKTPHDCNVKKDVEWVVRVCIGFSWLRVRSHGRYSENSIEPAGLVQDKQFLQQLLDCKILRKESVLCSYFDVA
jgi:hypothetical protein